MKNMRFLFYLFLLNLIIPWDAVGKNGISPDKVLDLNSVIEIAFKNNPQIKAAGFDVKHYENKEKASFALRLPRIDLEERFSRTTNPMWSFGTRLNQERIESADFNPSSLNNPDPINNFLTILSVKLPLYSGGAIINGIKIAELKKKESLLYLKSIQNAVIRSVRKAYFGLLLAKKKLKVVDQAINSAKANLSLVEARYGGGFSVKSDLLRAKVRLSGLEQKRFKMQGCIKIARARLNAAMGFSPDNDNEIVDSIENIYPVGEELNNFIARAIAQRSELKIMNIGKRIAEKSLDIAKAGHFPKLNAFANYEMDSESSDFDGSNYTVGASLSFNIFNGNRINSEIRAAESSVAKVKEMERKEKLKVEVEVREAYCRAMSVWQSISVAKNTVKQAKESLRIIKNRYKNGLVTMVSLLDGDLALEEARINYFQSVYDFQDAFTDLKWSDGSINLK